MSIIKFKNKKKSKIKIRTEQTTSSVSDPYINENRQIDYTTFKDGYIMIYDEESNTYKFVDPDTILSKSAENPPLPQSFIDTYGKELLNKLDYDGGEY